MGNRWPWFFSATATASAVMLIGACGSSPMSVGSPASSAAASTGPSHAAGTKVAILSLVSNAADQCMDQTMQRIFARDGLAATLYHSNFQPQTSNANIHDAITSGARGVIYKSQSAALDAVSIRELRAAGIATVFSLGPATPGAQPAVVMPPLGVQGGEQAVDTLLKLRPAITRIGFIPGPPGVAIIDETVQGWKIALARHHITAVASVPGALTSQSGSQVAQDMLQAHPDLQAIITIGDDMALAAARVVRLSGKSTAVVDDYGFSRAALDEVPTGDLLAVIYSPLDVWATEMAQELIATLDHNPHPSVVPLSLTTVTSANVGQIQTTC